MQVIESYFTKLLTSYTSNILRKYLETKQRTNLAHPIATLNPE